MKDYYKILHVLRTSSVMEIKRSYRRLANRYHPDKNHGSAAAEEQFKLLNEAYEVIGNPAKRKEYDDKYFSAFQRPKTAAKTPQNMDEKIDSIFSSIVKGEKRHMPKTNADVFALGLMLLYKIIVKPAKA